MGKMPVKSINLLKRGCHRFDWASDLQRKHTEVPASLKRELNLNANNQELAYAA